jgi:hypothetical protein
MQLIDGCGCDMLCLRSERIRGLLVVCLGQR